jgi:hypothetical protein
LTRSGQTQPLRGPRTSISDEILTCWGCVQGPNRLGPSSFCIFLSGANTALIKARRGGGISHVARVSPIERVLWRSLPILPACPVSTRRYLSTYSPISDLPTYRFSLRVPQVCVFSLPPPPTPPPLFILSPPLKALSYRFFIVSPPRNHGAKAELKRA